VRAATYQSKEVEEKAQQAKKEKEAAKKQEKLKASTERQRTREQEEKAARLQRLGEKLGEAVVDEKKSRIFKIRKSYLVEKEIYEQQNIRQFEALSKRVTFLFVFLIELVFSK
jgi:hypothetical protein